jgi:predicted nucleic acid-binding protein
VREADPLSGASWTYAALPVARHASHPFWRRIADISDPHSAYDAAYVVLAEALDAPL